MLFVLSNSSRNLIVVRFYSIRTRKASLVARHIASEVDGHVVIYQSARPHGAAYKTAIRREL